MEAFTMESASSSPTIGSLDKSHMFDVISSPESIVDSGLSFDEFFIA